MSGWIAVLLALCALAVMVGYVAYINERNERECREKGHVGNGVSHECQRCGWSGFYDVRHPSPQIWETQGLPREGQPRVSPWEPRGEK